MTNYDRAVQVIYDEVNQTRERGEILTAAGEAERLANALADAGLLAPDLPKPSPGPDGALLWNCETVWIEDDDDSVYIDRPESFGRMDPNDANFFALAVLAASQYAKEK